MTTESGSRLQRRKFSLGGALVALLGLSLFVYFVGKAGVADVAGGVLKVGWGFLVILVLSGLRFALRALAWTRCVEGSDRLLFRDAFHATLAGDALGNITPLGLLISEPAKVLLVRNRITVAGALPALAVENLFYTLSVALVFAAGFAALLVRFDAPSAWWLASGGLLAALVLLVTLAHGMLWRRVKVAGGALDWLQSRRRRFHWLDPWITRLRTVETRMHDVYPRSRAGLLPLALLELSFHVAGVAEVYVTLALISGGAPTWLDAFLLESANRFITVAFKFVPLRVGVDEAGTSVFADLLQFGTTAGVTLAIVRKARVLFWLAVGVASLTRRGLSIRTLLREADQMGMAATTPSAHAGRPASGSSPTAEVVLAIMARSPAAETQSAKTRLASVLPDSRDRTELYAAFVTDVVRMGRNVTGAALRVAYTPEGGASGFDRCGVESHELMSQRGHDLGEREHHLFEDLFAEGFRKAVIIGSDLPTLPVSHVTDAICSLDEPGAVVIGPSEDGGYYLLGLTAPAQTMSLPDLFTNIRWSTASALDDTVTAARQEGAAVRFAPPWYDVDDQIALERLRADLADSTRAARAPATAAALQSLFGRDG